MLAALDYQESHAFDLDTLNSPGSAAARVNRHGHIVGNVTRPRPFGAGTVTHGFLYRDGVMRDLNDLIDPRLGLEIITAQDINDLGNIVGSAQLRGTGPTRAVILTPAEADLIALEVNQVVQDLRNSVPLVAGKPSQVRAHVQSTNENLVGVTSLSRWKCTGTKAE